jgi:uncharacterized membrane protein YkoI
MKRLRLLLALTALLPILAVSRVCFAQGATPAPTPAAEIYEDEAWKIASARIPGKKVESEFDSENDRWIFHDLDAKGRECVVTVSKKTRAVVKVVAPKLTVKQALSIALKKVKGKRAAYDSDASTFDPKRFEHTFYIETPNPDQPLKVVTVSDKTSKVVGVSDKGDAG